MDVNTVHSSKVLATSVPSPVVPASRPDSDAERPSVLVAKPAPAKKDRVELSQESQVAAAAHARVVEHTQNMARGSRVYHDESTNRFVVEVVNSNNEVIRQIPLEEALESTRRFRKLTGLIFNQQA